jgi:hypothetical protein
MKQLVKLFISLILGLLFNTTICAQSPEKISYQAVVRDADEHLLINQPVGMQISILQGSADGISVYVERHFPTTNANGLVTIDIGNGTILEGLFAEIDWKSGPYFLKTETDLNGGSNYTLTAASQLLSVPYALHAKTAEIVTETDPTYASSQAANITATDITNLGNLSGVNTGDQSINRTGLTVTLTNGGTYQDSINTYTAGTGIDITNHVISTTGPAPLAIGDSYGGGIIFWLDGTGQHGLIVATTDQSTGIQWYNGTFRYTGATGDGLYAGAMNTTILVATQIADNQTGNFAAKVCADYSVIVDGVTYGDWYLPSKYELNLLYLQKDLIGGFASAYYWSSSELSDGIAWSQGFGDGNQQGGFKTGTSRVRAIRAF